LANIGVFAEAQPLVEEADDARVHDPVNNVVPIPAGAKDTPIHQALKLIGNSLRLHGDCRRQIPDGQLSSPCQGVQEPQAGIVGKNLEDVHQARCLFRRN
jgi:hypothetical protein